MKAMLVFLAMFAVPLTALADGGWEVLTDPKGNVYFSPQGEEKKKTGFTATDEAKKYPEAIKELLSTDEEFVPAETTTVSSRMTGLLTWTMTKETSLVLAKEGNQLNLRPPTETEWVRQVESVTNPFGLLAGIFFGWLLIGYLMFSKNRGGLTFLSGLAALATAFCVIIFFVVGVGDVVYNTLVSSGMTLSILTVLIATVFMVGGVIDSKDGIYKISTVVASTSMAILILVAVF